MEWMKGVEDLDVRIFRAQGILGVGVFILICIAWFPAAACRRTTNAG